MALFNFRKKDKFALTKKQLERFDGKPIQYAVERVDGIERVLGKHGGIAVLDDVIVVMCEAKEVFRCKFAGATVAELLSGNGVEISGEDAYTGEKRYVVAHYLYYRKV